MLERLEEYPIKKTVCQDYLKLRRELEEIEREKGLNVKEKFAQFKAEFILEVEKIKYEGAMGEGEGSVLSLGQQIEHCLKECNHNIEELVLKQGEIKPTEVMEWLKPFHKIEAEYKKV